MASSNVRITTQVVQFGTPTDDGYADAHLSAEIDDRDGGLNGGDTDFQPGDTAYFLIYKSSNVTLSSPVASAGSVSYLPEPETVVKVDYVTFANEPEGTLDVPATKIDSREWIGADLGATELVNEQTLRLTDPPDSIYAGVLKVTYTGTATVGKLDSKPFADANPSLTDFEIVVVVVGTVGA